MTPRRLIEPARLAGTVLRTQSDERLVDLVRDGNDRAFEAIVHRYRRALLRYCGRFLTPSRAEDAVQQAFVNALAALRSESAEINLRPWLYRIAHNAALNVLRQAGGELEPIGEEIDGVETPAQALERGEQLRTVVQAVKDLPPRQRDALVLQAIEGRSYDEIAAELGVSGGAVRQLLNRARNTLRDGASLVTPPALLARFGGVVDAPLAERIAQVVGGAGGGAALAKGAAVVVAAGAVVGGAVEVVIPPGGGAGDASPAVAEARAKPAPHTARPTTKAVASRPADGRRAARHTSAREPAPASRTEHGGRDGAGSDRSGEDRSGHREDGDRDGDDRSGHRDGRDDVEPVSDERAHDGDSSGPGSGETEDISTTSDSSGPGSGDDGVTERTESSGSDSGTSGSSDSGSGSSDYGIDDD